MPCGGAWEALIDKAAMQVSEYLSATRDAFHQDSRTAVWMLNLLDRGALRDVVVERNSNDLCGMVGCTELPAVALTRNEGQTGLQEEEEMQRSLRRGDRDECWESNGEDDIDDGDIENAFRQCKKYQGQFSGESGGETASVDDIMAKRFCSPDCAEQFAALLKKVPQTLVYARDNLVESVGGLFPNMQLAVLQRLAGAEATVVPNVREKEAAELRAESTGESLTPVVVDKTDTQESQLRDLLESIQAVQYVWSHGLQDKRSYRPHGGMTRRLPMPLVVYDWLGTISTERTKYIFATLSYANMRNGGTPVPAVGRASSTSLFSSCMQPILDACMARGRELSESCISDEVSCRHPLVDPVLQQQRQSFFVRHVFSSESSAFVSRLLMYDQATLERAWGTWHSSGLLSSLIFTSAVPGDLTCGGRSPARIYLATVLAAATALCAPAVWAEWLQEDNGLAEVLEALGCTPDDFVACVRALTTE